MRALLLRRSSTKAERIFHEILKKNHISFKYRVKEAGMEIDFIVGIYAIELDGHTQKGERNRKMLMLGYTPLHYSNRALLTNRSAVEEDIKSKHGLHITSNRTSSLEREP